MSRELYEERQRGICSPPARSSGRGSTRLGIGRATTCSVTCGIALRCLPCRGKCGRPTLCIGGRWNGKGRIQHFHSLNACRGRCLQVVGATMRTTELLKHFRDSCHTRTCSRTRMCLLRASATDSLTCSSTSARGCDVSSSSCPTRPASRTSCCLSGLCLEQTATWPSGWRTGRLSSARGI